MVRDPSQFPYVAASPQPDLNAVLAELWPHVEILDAYANVP
jgi:hypothetical protein